MAWHGRVRQDLAWLGMAGRGMARRGKAWQGRAWNIIEKGERNGNDNKNESGRATS